MKLTALSCILIGVLALYPVCSHSSSLPTLTELAVTENTDGSQNLKLSFDRIQFFRGFVLNNPNRLIIDMPDFTPGWGDGMPQLPDMIQRIDLEDHPERDYRRMIFDLRTPYIITQALGAMRGDLFTISFTLKKTSQHLFTGQIYQTHGPFNPDDPAGHSITDTPQATIAAEPFVITIDPGHGGRDPGAVGYNNLLEKDVTLRAARFLKTRLETANLNAKVHLTRNDDRFIPLYERIAIAHAHEADLFISLHADSLPDQTVKGVSLYTLSDKATDPQTAALAVRENRAGLMDGLNLPTHDTDITNILVDMAYSETVAKSEDFAATLTRTLEQAESIQLLRGPHRKAAFAVLRAPDVPSILIELGFMSNKEEARRLAQDQPLQMITDRIAMAVETYYQANKNR